MNAKTTGLVLLLYILVAGLIIHMIWKPMTYLEGLHNNNPNNNTYDDVYNNVLSKMSEGAATLDKQIKTTPEMMTNINKTLSIELNQILKSSALTSLQLSNPDFVPIISLLQNISAENASMISQILTIIIQFLTDLKAQLLTSNSSSNNGPNNNITGVYTSSDGSPINFSKEPIVISA